MARIFGAGKALSFTSVIFLSLLFSGLASCSGGGGGDGGGGNDGTRRSTKTGIRILHGALDIEPVDLRIGDQILNHSAFMETNFYSDVPSGSQLVTLERGNSPGVNLFQSAVALADKTEYSLLLSGQATRNNFNVTVLEEPVIRPAKGLGRVQLVNLLEGSAALILNGGGVTLGPVPFRLASGYVELPSGLQTFSITNDRGGSVNVVPTTVPEQGEVTIVLGGYASQGVVITKVYTDLD